MAVSLPLFKDDLPPINGSTVLSRHASFTGALKAQTHRSANLTALRQLWKEPRTMNEIAAITGLPLSSVCSLKAAFGGEIQAFDVIPFQWGDGTITKRTRWKLTAPNVVKP